MATATWGGATAWGSSLVEWAGPSASIARVSTAPAAITNLLAAFNLQSAVTTPSGYAMGVVRGEPQDNLPLDEAIYVERVTNRVLTRQQMVGGGGLGYLREDYTIPVEVRVFRAGDLATDVDARAFELAGAVESAIRADLTLGGAVLEAWPENSDYVDEWLTEPRIGRRGSLTIQVHCWASI